MKNNYYHPLLAVAGAHRGHREKTIIRLDRIGLLSVSSVTSVVNDFKNLSFSKSRP
jgi:hypothetical protein